MKKWIKKALLSTCVATAMITATAATALLNVSAAENTEITKFEMVDGAAIRLATPNGLRFKAEMDADTYASLTKSVSGVQKKMGMFIVPYDYLSDETRYSNGIVGVKNKTYENITTKIDLVFYDSDGSVENKIYQEGDNYRANGVITDLKLKNYDRDFIGIAYIAETADGVTTYTYADFSKEDDVRSAAYVAIEAYDDYKNSSTAKTIMENYVYGAHFLELGYEIEEEYIDGTLYYTYNNDSYTSLSDLASDHAESGFTINVTESIGYSLVGDSHSIAYELYEGDVGNGNQMTFNNVHAVWSSSNESVATVDENGVVTAVGEGEATITASFMGETASFTVSTLAFDGTFDSYTSVPTAYIQAGGRSTVEIAEHKFGNALKVTAEMSDDGNARVLMKYALMEVLFADPDVDYIAFDLKLPDDATDGTVYYNNASGSWTKYETGKYDAAPTAAYKTYYFPRSIYEAWLANGKTDMRFLNVATGVTQGESYYVDNIRAVTAEEYSADWYSFEYGGIRTTEANTPLLYDHIETGTWQLGLTNIDLTTIQYTNDNVTDGISALQFTKIASSWTNFKLNHTADTTRESELRTASYISCDLYVPSGSDAKLGTNSELVALNQGWNTLYLQVPAADASSPNAFSAFYDTTGSTYVIDNIRLITEEEFMNATLSFEGGALRNSSQTSNKAIYYWDATDVYSSAWSMAIMAEVGITSAPNFSTEIVKDGTQSLSVTKTDGYIAFSLNTGKNMYSMLKNGFKFWIYADLDTQPQINVSTSNFFNGANANFSTLTENIVSGTWRQITVTADDINSSGRFLIIQGSTAGTYYFDGFEPLDASTAHTITYDAGIGSVTATTQTVYTDSAYALATPTAYRDFLGWYDENGCLVPMSGEWIYESNVTLTAKYADNVSFEDGVVPSYMTMTGTASIVDMDTTEGNKALRITGSTTPGFQVPIEFLESFFDDESVDYIAFNAKTATGSYNNFRRLTWRSDNGGEIVNVTYEADVANYSGINAESWKTFYFSRADYGHWITKKGDATSFSASFITSGSVDSSDSFYIDNIYAITKAEYVAGINGVEGGNVRNDGTAVYVYIPYSTTWQWCFTQGTAVQDACATNEIVSNGNRAVKFTLTADVESTFRFNSASVQFAQDIYSPTGYYAFDLYVPEGANATLTASIGGGYPSGLLDGAGWRTVYSNSTTFMKLSDTTGSTYAIDNFRSVTAEEYEAATLGFESGTGGIRHLDTDGNVSYVYMNNGTDSSNNRASINVTGDGATSANVRYSTEQAHSGTTSLAIDKVSGAINFGMHVGSANYAACKTGFTFWIYSTVAIDGSSASNFAYGNGEAMGVTLPANTWTQVTIPADTFSGTTWLRLQGSPEGTIYIDDIEALPYELNWWNAELGEVDSDGVMDGLTLNASTHYGANSLPNPSNPDIEDMSYYCFNGQYGLNDYLVFDFTGDNIPLMTFFNTEVSDTIYNQEQDENVKGWLVTHGMLEKSGAPYGGLFGAHCNRITLCGPYKISYAYDDNGSDQAVTQVRTSIGSAADPSPISMAQLNGSQDSYRIIVGWVENSDSTMNLRMIAWNLTTGEQLVDYNQGGVAKADWEGDIALYGHFGRETVIDKLYPIEENTTMDEVVEKYLPAMTSYQVDWDGNQATLAQSTTSGSVNRPDVDTQDMSYIAFNGDYGYGDYLVFDFTGSNMPIVSFFNNEVTNTVYNNASTTADSAGVSDENAHGVVICGGLYNTTGSIYNSGGANACRLIVVGHQKVLGWDDGSNKAAGGFRSAFGSTSDVHPLSVTALQSVTDTYRVIIGFSAKGKLDVCAINMITGAIVYKNTLSVGATQTVETGSIALHGQFGKTTVLDSVFGVEEDTTMSALITKYAKDVDYSDESAVTLDRYGYASISNGTWELDKVTMCAKCGTAISGHSNSVACEDYRETQSYYDTYAGAGFNIMLPQDAFDLSASTWATQGATYMDKAQAAGLKVILTDSQLQCLSEPLVVSNGEIAVFNSSYQPWIISDDTSASATAYRALVEGLGFTLTEYTRNQLDSKVRSELALYKDHPAFYGVMLGDEPTYHNAYCYGELYKSIKRVMPECYVQYNLNPLQHNSSDIIKFYYDGTEYSSTPTAAQTEAAYKNYVTAFIDSMGINYIQYDDYPFKSATESVEILGSVLWSETTPYVDPTALRNIQLVAEIAKERDLEVKVVTQSCLMLSGSNQYTAIRQVEEEDARWLNNYLMGFGVKQINYFTYWTKSTCSATGENFVDDGSFVNRDGTTTAIYNFYKTIMAENDSFSNVIGYFDYSASQAFGSDSNSDLNNDHITWSTNLTATASFKWLSGVTTDNEYTLVTELYDEENYNYMYMVMNTIDPYYSDSEDCTQSVTITLDSSVTSFYVYAPDGTGTLVSGNTYTVSLTAGQAIYVMPCAF